MCIDLISFKFIKLTSSSSFFGGEGVDSLGFSVKIIMSVNKGGFAFSFQFCMSFISFSCLIALALYSVECSSRIDILALCLTLGEKLSPFYSQEN